MISVQLLTLTATISVPMCLIPCSALFLKSSNISTTFLIPILEYFKVFASSNLPFLYPLLISIVISFYPAALCGSFLYLMYPLYTTTYHNATVKLTNVLYYYYVFCTKEKDSHKDCLPQDTMKDFSPIHRVMRLLIKRTTPSVYGSMPYYYINTLFICQFTHESSIKTRIIHHSRSHKLIYGRKIFVRIFTFNFTQKLCIGFDVIA